MRGVEVRSIGEKDLMQFVMLPFRLYKDDPNWVAPLIKDQLKMLKSGRFLSGTEHDLLIGYRDGRPCARAIVGKYKGMHQMWEGRCYFSLPDAADPEALAALMGAVEAWARARGLGTVVGPSSPTDGEDDRGFLVEGFDGPPTLMGSYGMRWYGEEMERLGYGKELDFYTFLLTGKAEQFDERLSRALDLALKRTKATVSHIDSKHPMRDFKDMFDVLKASIVDYPDFSNPTWEEFVTEAKSLAKLADERLIWIARRNEDASPIAFVVAMPNWSEVLQKMRGRLFPFGWVHAVGAKKRIKGMRALMQFCLPAYRGSGVMSVLYMKIFEQALSAGYKYGEAGVIGADNFNSRRPIEAIGGKLYRTYRRYIKSLD